MTDTKTDNTALTDLIQLPDGNWIDPARVVGMAYMRPVPPIHGVSDHEAGHRIRVEFAGHSQCVPFESEADAAKFRDKLAYKVNAAKAALRMREMQNAMGGGCVLNAESIAQRYARITSNVRPPSVGRQGFSADPGARSGFPEHGPGGGWGDVPTSGSGGTGGAA